MKIAIIGTAGRDKTKPMTLRLWLWMVAHAKASIPQDSHLISGGAAWADHLAVQLFLDGHVSHLTLHLPAPMTDKFHGPYKSAASAANYYHQTFSERIGVDTLAQIVQASEMPGCTGSVQPEQAGYGGMFARNAVVAKEAEGILAYTFGGGKEPADGGTLDTWNKCGCDPRHKMHVTLPILY